MEGRGGVGEEVSWGEIDCEHFIMVLDREVKDLYVRNENKTRKIAKLRQRVEELEAEVETLKADAMSSAVSEAGQFLDGERIKELEAENDKLKYYTRNGQKKICETSGYYYADSAEWQELEAAERGKTK